MSTSLASKKSILIFLGSLTGGGAERVAVALAGFLAKDKSFNVTLVTLDNKDRDFYTLDKAVKRVAMDKGGETSGLAKFTSNIKRVTSFRFVLKNEKPDLVIAFMTRYAVIALLASMFTKIRVIVSERNYPPHRKNHGMWEALRKYVYRFADLHIVQTELIADWIKKNTKSNMVRVIPNSITWPLPKLPPTIETDSVLKDGDRVILAAGTFKHQKGFDLLLESMKTVMKESQNWKLVILGDEKYTNYLTEAYNEFIAQNDLTDKVIMPGRAGNVKDWYERAEIFVLSSRYEGFPNVLLEAMSSGCACVSFDCKTGPAELITEGYNGFLIPDGDTDLLAKYVLRLMQDNSLRERLSSNAISVRETYSEEKIMNMWKKQINKVLLGSP